MTREHEVQFMEISEEGKPVLIRTIKQSDIGKCPHCIMVLEHYREDGTCKCDDPNELVMKEWGYKFEKGAWR